MLLQGYQGLKAAITAVLPCIQYLAFRQWLQHSAIHHRHTTVIRESGNFNYSICMSL